MNKLLPLLSIAAATIALTASTSARADDMKPGFEVGARVGYGIPLGDASKDNKMSDGISGKIPFILDVGYRINPALYVGAFGQYAIGLVSDKQKDACDKSDCSFSVIRLGANLHYHFMTTGTVLPWAGIGAGYEIASTSVSGGGLDASSTTKGFEFVNLQLGADFSVASGFRAGPFASFSLAQYSSATVKIGDKETSDDIKDKTMHQWLTFGVRGAFTL